MPNENDRQAKLKKLEEFYQELRAGLPVATLMQRYENIIQYVHSHELTHDMRLGKGFLKRLRDEVAPTVSFAREFTTSSDKIRFCIDDSPFDCEIFHSNGRHRLIQVTIADGEERFVLMSELNKEGRAPGFIGPDKSVRTLRAKLAEQPSMHRMSDYQNALVSRVSSAASRKSRDTASDTLIIAAQFQERMNHDDLSEFFSPLQSSVARTTFKEVYLADHRVCYRLK